MKRVPCSFKSRPGGAAPENRDPGWWLRPATNTWDWCPERDSPRKKRRNESQDNHEAREGGTALRTPAAARGASPGGHGARDTCNGTGRSSRARADSRTGEGATGRDPPRRRPR